MNSIELKYKCKLHLATAQYCFIEVEVEDTPKGVVETYHEFRNAYEGGDGIPTKEFNDALDRYLQEGTGETETFLKMSATQQSVFQEIKKSFNRTKARESKAVVDGKVLKG